MKTLADIKRRTTPGVRLEVTGHTNRPELVGTIRIITRSSALAYWFTSSDTPDLTYPYRLQWPSATAVRILDGDTWEYDTGPHTVRVRFLPPESP